MSIISDEYRDPNKDPRNIGRGMKEKSCARCVIDELVIDKLMNIIAQQNRDIIRLEEKLSFMTKECQKFEAENELLRKEAGE